jgi:8-oxo-dGTP pyrophosphatase MutT (NUDIX family)
MNPYHISPLTKNLIVRLSGKSVTLPRDIQDAIDAYWESLLQSGKTYTRGEVFTVTKKETFDDRIELLVEKTDYAHYLYCQNIDQLGKYGVHIIHTAALVETCDEKLIFGKMGDQTSRSGIYQLCGGGIDNDDVKGDTFDFEHNIVKELQEELGIDAYDTQRVQSFELAYLKEGGPTDKMTVVYSVKLSETRDEFLQKYALFAKQLQEKKELPEFGEIVVIEKNKQGIEDFLSRKDVKLDEYMRPLFEHLEKTLG